MNLRKILLGVFFVTVGLIGSVNTVSAQTAPQSLNKTFWVGWWGDEEEDTTIIDFKDDKNVEMFASHLFGRTTWYGTYTQKDYTFVAKFKSYRTFADQDKSDTDLQVKGEYYKSQGGEIVLNITSTSTDNNSKRYIYKNLKFFLAPD